MDTGDALLIVDLQNDFLPGGALAVPDGDGVIGPLNRMIERFHATGQPIYASRDWHPADHCSFAAQGGRWPPHCVQETPGARFAAALRLPPGVDVISKATDPVREAYSGFDEGDLAERLRAAGVRRLFIGGLATDYCVRATVLDALKEGFEVELLTDAVRAVDAAPGDGERALAEMRDAGAELTTTEEAA